VPAVTPSAIRKLQTQLIEIADGRTRRVMSVIPRAIVSGATSRFAASFWAEALLTVSKGQEALLMAFQLGFYEVSLKIMSTSPARLASFYRPGFIGNHVTTQLSTQIDLSEDHRVPRARSESTLTSSLRPCTKGRTATCK
jgi:hypothetical protein